jgi:hypothetical protein
MVSAGWQSELPRLVKWASNKIVKSTTQEAAYLRLLRLICSDVSVGCVCARGVCMRIHPSGNEQVARPSASFESGADYLNRQREKTVCVCARACVCDGCRENEIDPNQFSQRTTQRT